MNDSHTENKPGKQSTHKNPTKQQSTPEKKTVPCHENFKPLKKTIQVDSKRLQKIKNKPLMIMNWQN